MGNIPRGFEKRRYEMRKEYAGIDEDIEAIPNPYVKTEKFIQPPAMSPKPPVPRVAQWPIPADKARQIQTSLGTTAMQLDLGGGKSLEMTRIPAGEFAMGDINGDPDEYPYNASAEKHESQSMAQKTVRGGSWYDRPVHARSGFRQAYPAWQKVHNVGIRIIVED